MALIMYENVVSKAIQIFPAASFGGPEGLHPQHLVNLTKCSDSGTALILAITPFVNMLTNWVCSAVVAPFCFDG